MDTRIAEVRAWEALDSRGSPTVACEVRLRGGARGAAVVPSGASRGSHEALELRDGGGRYGGLSVRRAVDNARGVLGPAVRGLDAADQRHLDAVLREADGTPGLSRLGANAVLAVSIASALAAADGEGVPRYRWFGEGAAPLLPLPMVNVLSGRAHGGAVDLQDFLVVPVGAATFAEALEWSWRVRRATAELAAARGLPARLVADEGGLGPPLPSNREALDLLEAGIERSGLRPGHEAAIAIDVAATQLLAGRRYLLASEQRALEAEELLAELASWCDAYPIVSLEDPFAEDDWEAWALATAELGDRLQLLGDDLLVTSLARLERAIGTGVANAVLVKPNQAGTLSDAFAVLARAREARYATVVSARSGESEDAWLADLAVGWRAGQIKVGSLTRGERTAKWNRLLAIEAELGADAAFAGRAAVASRHGRDQASR